MKKTSKKPVRHTAKRASHPKILLGRARFLPAIMIALFATFLSLQPHSMLPESKQVLAYATNTSQAGLLAATNTQRSNNGVATLSANSKLQAAAQAKAQDMVNRDYWSHQTPDGQQPWVFITNAGYQYSSAGENLAYGFMTSNDTVTGWMNSPPHKANLLSTNFVEVGFGIANSSNYVGDGPQTVVVAMYGKPLNYTPPAASSPAPAAPSITATKPAAQAAPAEQAPASKEPIASAEEEAAPTEAKDEEPIAIAANSSAEPVIAAPTKVRRVQLLGNPWFSVGAITFAVLAAGVLWLLHKGFHVRKFIVSGEHFILHHLHLDLTVLAVVYLGFVLLSNSGAVR